MKEREEFYDEIIQTSYTGTAHHDGHGKTADDVRPLYVDDDYKQITQEIRKGLLELAHVSPEEYTAVLMQGSGSFGVESVLTSVIGAGDELLICANGAYGERMADIAEHAGIKYHIYNEHYNKVPNAQKVAELLDADPAVTHVAMVHSETTSGILNDIEAVGKVVRTGAEYSSWTP